MRLHTILHRDHAWRSTYTQAPEACLSRQRRVRPMRRQMARSAERVKTLPSDAPGRILIPVENNAAVLASVCGNLKAFSLSGESAAAAALLRGVMRTNSDQLASGSFGLVGKLLDYKTTGLPAPSFSIHLYPPRTRRSMERCAERTWRRRDHRNRAFRSTSCSGQDRTG